jgi:hypothetical protein
MTATGTPYDEFQAKADREIPVVVLEPGYAERSLTSTTPNAPDAGQAARLDGPKRGQRGCGGGMSIGSLSASASATPMSAASTLSRASPTSRRAGQFRSPTRPSTS